MWRNAPANAVGRPAATLLARPGYRRAAEIERAAVARAERLDAARIEKFLETRDRRGSRRDVDRGTLAKRPPRRRSAPRAASAARRPAGSRRSPRRARPRARTTSAMRSVPDACSRAVSTASAPKPLAAVRIRASSVAIVTEAAPLARAHSHTHWISGRPPIASSGLPGRRLAANRAGITT